MTKMQNGADDDSTIISGMQDISTFGFAGRIWEGSYKLEIFMRRPSDQYTFTPPCPIAAEYFLAPKAKQDPPSGSLTSRSQHEHEPQQKKEPIRVIEIGAGTGFVGINLAKRLCADCTLILTDLEKVVPLLQKNVNDNLYATPSNTAPTFTPHPAPDTSQEETSSPVSLLPLQNHATVTAEALAWGDSEQAKRILSQGKIDFVIASELVYFPEMYPQLLQTLKEVTDMETRVIFGYKERAFWKELPFWEQFGRFFEMEVVRIDTHDNDKEKSEEGNDEGEEKQCGVRVFGREEEIYVFVAKKRSEDEILEGVDDTLTTLMMMEIGY
ncbi:hypothetical protein BGW38_007330 [Lunasporangiospora selenospora]|uniref:Methyltransferase n=1 Tax=Lunasporangiospora selenospora TaxID=979761 RepID=A0A9P6FYE7_9FUNG|nr:hypothetical protein BGW38_007330 [Lunasporangiospora selenospora]